MKSDKKIYELDALLKRSLHDEEVPDDRLHRQIMQEWREKFDMKRKRSYKAAAAAVICVGALSAVSVHAGMRFLGPKEAVEEMGYGDIAALFEGEEAVRIGETQNGETYAFTLLGMTEGANLMELNAGQGAIEENHFYAVVGISNLDGSPLTAEEFWDSGESYFISPFIQGLEPWRYNISTMGGGYAEAEADGIVYRMIDCDAVSCFADREIYLGVLNRALYEKEAYHFDESTGVMTPSAGYEGTNLLFRLPIDESKADPEQAARIIEELSGGQDEERTAEAETAAETGEPPARTGEAGTERLEEAGNFITSPEAFSDYQIFLESLDGGAAAAHSALADLGMVQEDRQTIEEKDGVYLFERKTGDGAVEQTAFFPEDFENGNGYSCQYEESDESAALIIVLPELNEDGTMTCTLYRKEYPL